jgi:KaiC/GvpD/RAD55 family RecA-like ATPase
LIVDVFTIFENQEIVKKCLEYREKYNKFPTIREMEIYGLKEDVLLAFTSIQTLDVSEYEDEFILDRIEEFFKKKLIHNQLLKGMELLGDSNASALTSIPDKLRESLSFGFKTNIGLEVFSDEGEQEWYDELHKSSRVIASRIKALDDRIDGGFPEQTISLFLASTGKGKSLVLCALTTNFLMSNKSVLYITLEISKTRMTNRIVSNLFDVNINELKFLSREDVHRKFQQTKSVISSRLVVEEFPQRSINANHIRNLIKELKVKKNFVPDVVVVDYIGIMLPIHKDDSSKGHVELQRITQELRAISQELKHPVLSAIQTNRKGVGSTNVDLNDVAASYDLTHDADLIVAITQSEEQEKTLNQYSWSIIKNRFGMVGRFVVGVDKFKMRIYDVEQQYATPINQSSTNQEDATLEVKTNLFQNKKSLQNKVIQFE